MYKKPVPPAKDPDAAVDLESDIQFLPGRASFLVPYVFGLSDFNQDTIPVLSVSLRNVRERVRKVVTKMSRCGEVGRGKRRA